MENQQTSLERRLNQSAKLLGLLKANSPHWVPLMDVVAVAGLQYSARIHELRRLGHRIDNDPGRAFRLTPIKPAPPTEQTATPTEETGRLFPDDAPLPHVDLG
jgi:hypothetical protein